jgi:hypothetical protein
VKRSLHVWFEVTDCYKSVATKRQVKTENPSACAKINRKVCRSAMAAVLPVVPSSVDKVSINPIIQSITHKSHNKPLQVELFLMVEI